jgi:Family of unknown function (DUF6079)
MVRLIKTEVARRFQRSIRLDSDFRSKTAIADYVPLAGSLSALMRMGDQIAKSSQRAFTWTGPYGGGKSSLALVLASLLDSDGQVRRAAQSVVGASSASRIQKTFGLGKSGWLVMPIVGQRDSIVKVLDGSLTTALHHRLGSRLPKALVSDDKATGKRFLDRLSKVADQCIDDGDGILIIIDEMGRFLEHSATTDGDISFFQELAEIVGRLKAKVVVVGILHQAFEQYASKLGADARDEWAKIQGRFVDVPLTTGTEETVRLISQALVGDKAPTGHAAICTEIAAFAKERRVGLPNDFAALLRHCWPLHPMVALLLASVSRKRFGQNERSTFGFLNSGEPQGFQDFLSNAPDRRALYGLGEFWDYLHINLEPAIMASSEGHRWAQAVEAVDRAESKGDKDHLSLAKGIAIIDLFGAAVGLYADDGLIRSGLLGVDADRAGRILDDLRTWSIVVFRAHSKSWAVFAGSDFDIDAELAAAKARIEVDFSTLQKILTQQVIIAKKHYYERGTLRWFDVRISALDDISKLIESYHPARGACGLFVLAVPRERERLETVRLQAEKLSEQTARYPYFIGVSQHAWDVRALTQELSALEYVRSNASTLEGDRVARRELAARSAGMREQLDQKMTEMLGAAFWCRAGRSEEIQSIASLTRAASDCAAEVFEASPIIKNELINRTKPSSNAISAANELMRLMVLQGERANLSIEGYPPQRAIYDSMLAVPGIHRRDRQSENAYKFDAPTTSEVGKSFAAMWAEGERFLEATEKERLPLSHLYERWSKAPFGLRSGVIPIYALALVLANEHQLALYLDGYFAPQMDAFFVDRMLQDPKAVEVRKFHVAGVARSALERLSSLVTERAEGALSLDALSVAKPLVAFVRSLHPWAKRTRTLDKTTLACRDTMAKASDPIALLFEELPVACGLAPITYNIKDDLSLRAYTDALRSAVNELRAAYPRLLDKLTAHVGEQLGGTLATDKGRFAISERAGFVAGRSGDFRLDAFATRLKTASSAIEWIESIGGLAANKPVRDWIDNDIDRAMFEISDLCVRFKRVEAVAKTLGETGDSETVAIVVGHGKESRSIIQTIDVTPSERELAHEALDDLRTRLAARGLAPSRVLAVVTEIAKEIIVSNTAPSQELSEAIDNSKETKTWQS